MVNRSLVVLSLLLLAGGCVDDGRSTAAPASEGATHTESAAEEVTDSMVCTDGRTLTWNAEDWWFDGQRGAKRPVYPEGIPPELILDACRLTEDEFANR